MMQHTKKTHFTREQTTHPAKVPPKAKF